MTAGLLGIFLGGLGIHNFYLGYTGKAIAQIALSLCFGAGAIWGLIEGIMILTGTINKDANGVPSEETESIQATYSLFFSTGIIIYLLFVLYNSFIISFINGICKILAKKEAV